MVRKCISKEELRCFCLTKNNCKDLLEELYPDYKNDYILIEITDSAVKIKAYDMIHMSQDFQYGWYVEEENIYQGYPTWRYYSDKYFKENFKLVDEEKNITTIDELEYIEPTTNDNGYAKELEQRLFLLTGCEVFGNQDGMVGCCVDCCDENPELFDKCTEFTRKVSEYNLKSFLEDNYG